MISHCFCSGQNEEDEAEGGTTNSKKKKKKKKKKPVDGTSTTQGIMLLMPCYQAPTKPLGKVMRWGWMG